MKLIITVTAENSWSVWSSRFCWVRNAANESDSLFPSSSSGALSGAHHLSEHIKPNVGFESVQSAAQCQSSLTEELLESTLWWN